MRFLFVDRILSSISGQKITGLKHITPDDFYLTHDKDGRTCFVPSLMGETLGQLAAWNVMAHYDFNLRPVAGVVGAATLFRPAYVGETLYLETEIEKLDESLVAYHGFASVDGQEVFRLEGAIGPMLPMQDFIDRETVLRQYAEVNRQGEWVAAPGLANEDALTGALLGPRASKMTYDRVIESIPGESMTAVKQVSRASIYFADHFPAKPVLPLTVLLECNLNLALEFAARAGWSHYRTYQVRRVKMNDFIMPGDVVTTHVKIKRHDEEGLVLTYRTEQNGRRVCLLEVVLKGDEHV